MTPATGRYSRVSRRIWNDDKVRRLSNAQPCGKFLFIRLLTTPELTCIPGLFQARESGLAEAIGWSLKGFRESFTELFREGLAKADWDVGLVWFPNAITHNEPPNPNVVISWGAAWAELPECELKAEAHGILRSWTLTKSASFTEAFDKACPNHSSNHSRNHSPPKRTRTPVVKSPMTMTWQPSAERLAAVSERTGIPTTELARQVPEFRLYWLPGGKGNPSGTIEKRSCDWDSTFSNRIDQLIEWGKLTVSSKLTPKGEGKPGQSWHSDGYWYYPLPKTAAI